MAEATGATDYSRAIDDILSPNAIKVLQKRYEATEGARKLAAESLERAAAKTAEYAAAMRTARAEVYQSQEQLHRELQEREAALAM